MLTYILRSTLFILLALKLFACTPSRTADRAELPKSDASYTLDASILDGGSAPFIKHEDDKPFGSYLAMNLPYAPVKSLFDEIERTGGQSLITRGEAHITVVTPVEFDKVLKKHLSISEISKIALDAEIQSATFDIVCLGKSELVVGNERLTTYFVVVTALQLLEIRTAVQQAYIKAGGAADEFSPEGFYPHITVGFSKRDLHFEDGILKDKSACTADLLVRIAS